MTVRKAGETAVRRGKVKSVSCAALAGVCLSLSLLAGCASGHRLHPWDVQETAFQIQENGTLKETIVDALQESYYSAQELEQTIRDEVDQYNREKGEAETRDRLHREPRAGQAVHPERL